MRKKGKNGTKATRARPRPLLVTTTREPFQPVRLYYRIPSAAVIKRKLRSLECMAEAPAERCWQWLYQAEAAGICFSLGGYEDVPESMRPIVLARLRFPKRGGMILEASSFDRAVEAAKFFGPRLGPRVVAIRGRVVNRCFGNEGDPAELMKHLDRDVTVIDPRDAEARLEADLEGVTTPEELEQAIERRRQLDLESGRDVPLVEDFPLAPEEETPDFFHLKMTLHLRMVRAYEHWRGNTHLTLSMIIRKAIEDGQLALP